MFDISNIIAEIWGYPLSYAELIGTVFGLICVYLASRENVLTWPAGIVNELFFFVIFFQVHLYANMFLQVIFFFSTMYGWYKWKNDRGGDESVTRMVFREVAIFSLAAVVLTGITGYLISHVNQYFPRYFEKASYPYIDSLVMVLSVIATILLARKKLENWVLWVIIDVISVILYFLQGVYFIALEYLILLGIASFGLFNWTKKMNNG